MTINVADITDPFKKMLYQVLVQNEIGPNLQQSLGDGAQLIFHATCSLEEGAQQKHAAKHTAHCSGISLMMQR